MTTIYLVRHGQKQPHAGDPGLTETGLKQARETGEFLKQFPINKIIASPYKRTVETAEQICTNEFPRGRAGGVSRGKSPVG